MPTIGEQIKRLRKAAGLTQQQLASDAGLSMSAIIHMEAGRVPRPRLDTLRKLAKVLSCTLDELAGDENGGEEEKPKKPRKRKS
jgi:transcriptional regulator with XRE-family HTH domain